ncbi:hypothetical protein NQ318_016397 [Aromia moschata]|uniref:GIY-YIG domain-containing protein n=1 Tax=Aromia moschata TaxID=1265417 RepID=A0AAV8Z3J6_9CUCU|nr:hypothetical protein NQ318_016397 [Aromia moschata]
MASFNFLIHRLLNFPLSKEKFEHEKQLIKNIAKSNGYSVHLIDKRFLGNPKDKLDNNEKSGIYEISCKDCDQKYIGQTKRSILTRFKEHMAHLKYDRTEKS